MKIACSIILLSLLSFFAAAQERYQITGKVLDSAANIKLANASISILNVKDSTLVKFGWADLNGDYSVGGLKSGKFILLLSYPGYVDYVQQFTLDPAHRAYSFGITNLNSKVYLLNEVIIKGKVAAIKMKGDTTEFNARAFVIQPNAKVEDLLRQLPGIQVDNNGKILAYGQPVKKVLVEGEEFFGDDPTLITRNLRGDMIDKVQLYDKKSDQAAFTGIDDGRKEKTINLKLKNDKKNGYFGKIEAGVGTDKLYQLQAMLNVFRERQKIAVYGNLSNTGKTGLSSADNYKYGTSGGAIESIQGGIVLAGNSADEIESRSGRYNGEGMPMSRTSGIHYDGKWNKDKESINTNYKIGSLRVNGERNTITQNDLPDGLMLDNLAQNFTNYNNRQKLDVTYQIKYNSNSTLKLIIAAASKNNESANNYAGASFNKDYTLINRSNRKITDNADQQALNLNAFYSHKLKKEGRTFSWNFIGATSNDNSEGYLNANTDFYNIKGELISKQQIDQYKINKKAINAFNNNVTYTEPFSKKLALVLNYRLGLIESNSDRKSLSQSLSGKYDLLDTEFSNNYDLNQFSNQIGTIFSYKKDKSLVNLGTRLTAVDFKQLDRLSNISYNRNFLNWNPQFSYQIQFSPEKLLTARYTGNTVQPTIDQIQPVKTNNDPLNIMMGNADLHPAFKNDLHFGYSIYNVISGLSINIISDYISISNPIIAKVNADSLGKRIFQYLNLKDKHTSGILFRGDIYQQLKDIHGGVGLDFYFDRNETYGIVNDFLNKRVFSYYSSMVNFSRSKSKKYDFILGFGPEIFRGYSSLQDQLKNNGYGYNGYLNLNMYLPAKFEFKSNSTYNYQSKTDSFDQSYHALIVNASIAKKFLKNESLKFSIAVNDLFNQNIGFNRNSLGTMVVQNTYNVISRYYMCSLTLDFSKFGSGLKNQK